MSARKNVAQRMVVCQAYAIPSFDSLRSGETGKDDRGQKAEIRGQRSDVRGQKTDDRRQTTEDRRQKAEDRGQRVDFRFEIADC